MMEPEEDQELLFRYAADDLHELIASRRSIRRYRGSAIDAAVVERLLKAAVAAPSAHNRQPWRFAVLDDAAVRHRLATAMGTRLREDRLADGDDPVDVARDVERSYARITEAPVAILVCLDLGDMDQYPDERRRTAEYVMAIQSTAMAIENMLLAAHAEGFGACVMCAPLFCGPTVSEALQLPAGWQPQSLVTIGRAADGGKARPRLPLDAVVWRPGSYIRLLGAVDQSDP